MPQHSVPDTGSALDRAGLAERAGVPAYVVDLVIDAGLLAPSGNGAKPERFGADDVEMLVAARTLVGEGVAVEELAALAMRHATNVEDLIDDAIDLLKRQADLKGGDRAALAASVQRLVPVATKLVVGHFERTLWARAMARIDDRSSAAAGTIMVKARRLRRRFDPLEAWAALGGYSQRSVWLRPDDEMGIAALGEVEAITPSGADRFSAASAARAVLAARIRRCGPDDAPAPVLLGGFSFSPGVDKHAATSPADSDALGVVQQVAAEDLVRASAISPADSDAFTAEPQWADFGDCRLVLPEITVIDSAEASWVLAATRVGDDGDEPAAEIELDRRLDGVIEQLDQRLDPSAANQNERLGRVDTGPHERLGRVAANQNERLGQADAEPHERCDPVVAVLEDHPRRARPEPTAPRDCDRDPDYETLVKSAVAEIGLGEFQKVVLARHITLERRLDAAAVLDRLRYRNPNCALFAFTSGDSTFLGGTPETLVTLQGSRLRTAALAGTTPRGDDAESDELLGAALQNSSKNLAEHRFVVDGITDALAGLGLVDPAPAEPGLMRLNSLQHLHTPITAQVQRRRSGASDMDVLRVAGVLHPTAAVGGTPTSTALEFIANREGFHRGWYAAPVGWCDLDGNGELCVALRSALCEAGYTHLFAGAGIVADSTPSEELQETAFKLRALLDVIEDR